MDIQNIFKKIISKGGEKMKIENQYVVTIETTVSDNELSVAQKNQIGIETLTRLMNAINNHGLIDGQKGSIRNI